MVSRAKLEDLPLLAPRIAALPLMRRYQSGEDRLLAAWRDALGRGDDLFLARDESGPIGLAWGIPRAGLGLGSYLRLLVVASGTQRQGVGRALLAAYEACAFEQSRHSFLLVSDFNHEAQLFYQRQGYRQVGALPDLVLSGVSELIFWRARS